MNALRNILLSLCLLSATKVASSQNCQSVRYLEEVFDNVVVTSNIQFGEADPYGIIGSQSLMLDLYSPEGDTLEKRPLIIYAFGGGFLIGTRNQPPIPEYCERWARMGYVVASIDYRIGFNTTSSASAERAVYRGVQDVRAAMRFLGQFSAGYGIDTTNIFLTGSSAGCFSALHSTFMEENDRPQSTYGITLEPADMGCADCSGNNHLNNRELRPKGIINHWGAMLDTLYIDPSEKDNVPVISFHGTNDLIVPYESGNPFSYPIFPVVRGSLPIHQRLENLGVMNQLIPLDGIGHEPWLTDGDLIDTSLAHSAPFLYEIMRPQTSQITGNDDVNQGTVHTYTVSGQFDSYFCWEVTGGTIVSNNGGSVDILWDVSGTQTVSVTEVSCIEVLGQQQTLDVAVSVNTSIGESENAEILLYPNPASGWLNISNVPCDIVHVTISGIDGNEIMRALAKSKSHEIRFDCSNLSEGVYLVKLNTACGVMCRPLLVKP